MPRGFTTEEEEAEYYWSLTLEQRRKYRIEGHAYYVSLRPENSYNSQEQNWEIAFREMLTADPEIHIDLVVRSVVASRTNVAVERIDAQTDILPHHRRFLVSIVLATVRALPAAMSSGCEKTVEDLVQVLCQQIPKK